jgi:hypothetical protein
MDDFEIQKHTNQMISSPKALCNLPLDSRVLDNHYLKKKYKTLKGLNLKGSKMCKIHLFIILIKQP